MLKSEERGEGPDAPAEGETPAEQPSEEADAAAPAPAAEPSTPRMPTKRMAEESPDTPTPKRTSAMERMARTWEDDFSREERKRKAEEQMNQEKRESDALKEDDQVGLVAEAKGKSHEEEFPTVDEPEQSWYPDDSEEAEWCPDTQEDSEVLELQSEAMNEKFDLSLIHI